MLDMRFVAFTITLFFSALAYAGEPTKLDLLRSDYYVDQAQEQFGLTKEARDAFKQLKLSNMMAYREVIAPLKKEGKDDEAAIEAQKLNRPFAREAADLLNCSVKDFWSFNKRVGPEMQKIKRN
jgi:hypothetical protein